MFQKASLVQRFIKVNLWGDMKAGKTCCALSFPKPLAVIDASKGTTAYVDQYEFDLEAVTRWEQLQTVMAELPGRYKSLLIDDLTPLYQDLIEQVRIWEEKRGYPVVTQQGWGIVKGRWKTFMRLLSELPMHIAFTCRAKDEYEQLADPVNPHKDISKKTGDLVPDIDRSTNYLVDFILQCKCVEEGPKKGPKKSRWLVAVKGSRRPEIPVHQVYDVTGKNAFDMIFGDVLLKYAQGTPAPSATVSASELGLEAPRLPAINTASGAPAGMERTELATPSVQDDPPPATDRLAEMGEFGDKILQGARTAGEPATAEDLKVLFTRAGEITWPNGEKLKSAEAKALAKALYGVESAKDLYKHEVDFLYEMFGEILAGRAYLALEGEGKAPTVHRVKEQQSA